MTPTAIDPQTLVPPTALVRQADINRRPEWEWKPPTPDRSFFQAFVAVQKFHTPVSTIQFAVLPTAGVLPTTNDVIVAVFDRLSKQVTPLASEEMSSWDVEIDFPVWKGPKGVRVQALVKKVSCGTFRQITEDDIGGI